MSRVRSQTLFPSILLFLFAFSSSVQAEMRFGLGAVVNPAASTFSNSVTAIIVPIKIGASLMLEPTIGFRNIEQNTTFPNGRYSKSADRFWYYSLGIYATNPLKKSFEIYYGAEVGIDKFS